ncbi:hypothetical protein R3P38DRAFT_3191168 [Favolaschia claudopus]|uniref:BZIP domain-containing protein n=1 Tax=Favolaschia claudopus TaxID=2862362 RepID=A0AAV9ZWG9_9AGAR
MEPAAGNTSFEHSAGKQINSNKKAARDHKNRVAAQLSRARQKAHLEQLLHRKKLLIEGITDFPFAQAVQAKLGIDVGTSQSVQELMSDFSKLAKTRRQLQQTNNELKQSLRGCRPLLNSLSLVTPLLDLAPTPPSNCDSSRDPNIDPSLYET